MFDYEDLRRHQEALEVYSRTIKLRNKLQKKLTHIALQNALQIKFRMNLDG